MFEYPYLVYLFGFILSEASKLIDFLFSDIYLKGFPYFFPIFYPLFWIYFSSPTLAIVKPNFVTQR